MLSEYFPEAYAVVSPQMDAKKYRIASEIAPQKTIDAKIFFSLVSEAVGSIANDQEAKKYLIDKIDSLTPNWKLESLPPFEGINRQSVDSLPLKMPFGKVWSLVGVPKIGKTSLLLQLKRSWGIDTIKWYDCPIKDDTCSTTIALDLLKTILPSENEKMLLDSSLLLESSLKNQRKFDNPLIYVIDNANLLSAEGLKQLAQVLLKIKCSHWLTNIGFIFTTNKNLPPLRLVLDEEVVAPAWTSGELSELLQFNRVPFDSTENNMYIQSLNFFSGGHPLLAIALARKYPSTTQLISKQLQPGPKIGDENLSREVQSLLYGEILCDADSQNLVQRLSILGSRVPRDILEALRTDIVPQIGTPSSVIIDRAGQSLIEGDDKNGYAISFIFRKIAAKKISSEETQLVFQAVSKKFLVLTNKTINADRVCWGIFYACLSRNFKDAYYWTSIVVWKSLQNNLNKDQISSLLSRLDFLFYFQPEEIFSHQFARALVALLISNAYSQIGDYKKSADVLKDLRIDNPTSEDPEIIKSARFIRFLIPLYRTLSLSMLEPSNAMKAFSNIDMSDFEVYLSFGVGDSENRRSDLFNLLAGLITRHPLSDLSPTLIHKLIEQTKLDDIVQMRSVAKVVTNIAF